MGRKTTGTVRILKHEGQPYWHARYTRANGTRSKWGPLPGTPIVVAPCCYPTDPECSHRRQAKASAVKMAAKIKIASAAGGVETVEGYSKRWLDDREGRVASIRDDRSRMRDHVLPVLGSLDAAKFTRDDVEQLRDALDAKIVKGELAWKTAASCWTLVTSMCADMVNAKKRELRAREDNPCRDVKPPERGARKAKQYLYPSEFLQFVRCEDVPIRWRRAVALAVYTYARDAELRVLRWDEGDVDLAHGVLSVTRAFNRRKPGEIKGTKSDAPRRFALEGTLLPLLRALHDERGGKGPIVDLSDRGGMANTLRRWLWNAGVRRPELHEGSATRKPMTWHDLRATGITWMAVRGDDPLKIKQRAGHSTFSTTEVYIREAEAVREGFGQPFPPLPACLFESPRNRPGRFGGSRSSLKQGFFGGADGNRTRDLLHAMQALSQLSYTPGTSKERAL